MKIGQVPEMVKKMTRLGNRLSLSSADIPRRLADNVIHDPVTSVRQRNLEILIDKFPGHEESVRAARAARRFDHPATRMLAGRFLGIEGLPVIRDLVMEPAVDHWIRVQALTHYLASSGREKALALIAELLPDLEPGFLSPIIAAGVRFRDTALMNTLFTHVDDLGDEDATELATGIVQTGNETVESGLLLLLKRSSDTVRLAAVKALARTGSIAAVEPLLELTRGTLVPTGSELKTAAREAIDQIQHRLGDVEEGRLSFPATSEYDGGLSVAAGLDSQGALSYYGDSTPEGGLSLESEEIDSTLMSGDEERDYHDRS
jgi:hypothetical protein